MKLNHNIILSGLFITSLFCITTAYAKETHTAQIVQLKISDLKPTQPSIGLKEVDYKIANYTLKKKKLFDDYCEDNGAKGISKFSSQSNLNDLNSFSCKLPYGAQPKDMKTAVIGPNQQYYLTDGHHFVSALQQISGPDTLIFLRVTQDRSNVKSEAQFANDLQRHHLTWLKDLQGQPLDFSRLPKEISLSTMQNDEYRSILYFLKDVSFKKSDQNNIPFLEFYLAQWIAKKVPLSTLKLDTRQDYYQSLQKVAYAMTAAPQNETIAVINGQPISAQQFGIFTAVNKNQLHKLIDPQGKVTVLFSHNN